MYYTKKQAQSFSIPGGTVGWIYPTSPLGDQTVAMVKANGRYPIVGWSVNSICTETLFILRGQLIAEVDGQKINLKKGDLLMILPGKKYCLSGKAEVLDLITPAWDKSQNNIINS